MLTQNPVECKSYCRKIAGVRKIRDEEMEGGRVRETESEDGRRGGGGKDEGDGEEGKEKKKGVGEDGGKKDVWMVTKKSFTKCSLEDLPQAELVAPLSLAAYIISHL